VSVGFQIQIRLLTVYRYIVLDEADELVRSSWEDELKVILSPSDVDRNILMFSATFSKDSREAANKYLEPGHLRFTVGRVGSSHHNVSQNFIWVDEHQKVKALLDMLLSLPPCKVMIFCNNIKTAEMVDDELFRYRLPVTSIHSRRTQTEREDAL
jgi:ATP-dependent RNA helicase DDX3X